jgi:hypothetical protein
MPVEDVTLLLSLPGRILPFPVDLKQVTVLNPA